MHKIKELSKYLLPFVIVVAVYSFFINYSEFSGMLSDLLSKVFYVLNRFLIGFILAYLMNFSVVFFKNRLRFPKWLAITSTYLILLGALTWFVVYLTPIMADSINDIVAAVPLLYSGVREILDSAYLQLDDNVVKFISDGIKSFADGVVVIFKDMLEISSIQNAIKSSTRVLMDISFGVLISVYALIEKEEIIKHSNALINAIIPKKRVARFLSFFAEANRQFSKFLVGKFIDSLIIGVMSFILYSVFKVPLGAFFAVVAGVTNMIPYFGPMAGGVVTISVLLCIADPIYTLYALIIVIIMQTIDGLLLGPKILGDAVGISPLLIIIAITVGGDIGGFIGMLIGVPLMAVIKTMFYDGFLKQKKDEEPPENDENHPDKPRIVPENIAP